MRQSLRSSAFAIDEYLHKNYVILEDILGAKKAEVTVEKDILKRQKFKFQYHTHIQQMGKEEVHCLYNIGWNERNNRIRIVKTG